MHLCLYLYLCICIYIYIMCKSTVLLFYSEKAQITQRTLQSNLSNPLFASST